MYQNEVVIGRVLKRWLDSGKIKREELFIVTKLPVIGMRREHVFHFLEKSLKSLQLDYVDLYLIHAPVGFKYFNDHDLYPTEDGQLALDFTTNHVELWKAGGPTGRTKSIGLSNFSSVQIERIMKNTRIQPASHQVELFVYCQQKPLREACNKYNITVCAYGPLGSPGRKEVYKNGGHEWELVPVLEDPVILEIAKAHGKTAAQVLLRFLIQQNIAVIPKSTNPERVKSNFDVFDFTLTESEMKKLEALDKGADGRTFNVAKLLPPGYAKHPEIVTTYG